MPKFIFIFPCVKKELSLWQQLQQVYVYKDNSMHGGMGFSEYKLKAILDSYLEILEFREMVESADENVYGKSFLWTVLMKKK